VDLWQQAHEKIRKQADDANAVGRDAYITFHACWFHLGTEEYIPAVNPQSLLTHRAKCLVTLIDDVYDTRTRLRHDGRLLLDEFGAASESECIQQAIRQLLQVLHWRMQEIFSSEYLANSVTGGKHFLFPIKHPCQTLFKLLYELHTPRVYLSHPISEPRRLLVRPQQQRKQEGAHCMQEIQQLSSFLRQSFTLFEPTAIDELRFVRTLLDGREIVVPILSERWALPEDEGRLLWIRPEQYGDKLAFDCDLSLTLRQFTQKPKNKQAKQTLQAVAESTRIFSEQLEAQVNARDHKLVEQSDGLAVFRPFYRGNRSTGVEEEIKHVQKLVVVGRASMKPVCVVNCPKEDRRLYPSWELRQLLNGWIERGIIQPQDRSDNQAIRNLRWAISDGQVQGLLGLPDSMELIPNFQQVIKQHKLRLVLPKAWKEAHGGALEGTYAKQLKRWLDEEANPQLQ
jgi:hypothetical protein